MTDIWELARHVEGHPDDHKARWRLAKGLFQSEQYRLALEHILVLKNEWIPKVNLVRYLAATYYRLGRYNDAIAELEEAAQSWPEELGLLEQLARTLEMAGKRREAIAIWERIRGHIADHPTIDEAIARLNYESDAPVPEPAPSNVDSDLMAPPGEACPHCGAQNSPAFERCWKCRTPLGEDLSASAFTAPLPRRTAPQPPPPLLLTVAGAFITAALLGLGVYLAVTNLAFARQQAEQGVTLRAVSGLLGIELLPTRLAIGIALLVAWPVGLWLGVLAARARRVAPVRIVLAGLFLACATFCLFWAPLPLLLVVLAAPVALSVATVALVFRVSVAKSAIISAIQAAFVLLVVLGTLFVAEGFEPLGQYGAIMGYADKHDAAASPGVFPLPALRVPATRTLRWESTGSTWLDERSHRMELLFEGNAQSAPVTVELKTGSETLVYEHHESNPFTIVKDIAPGATYELVLTGQQGIEFTVTAFGILSPSLGS